MLVAVANAVGSVAIPADSAKSIQYHNTSNWFWLINQGLALLLALVLVLTRWGAGLHQLVSEFFTRRRIVSVAVFALLYFLLDRLVRLPIAFLWDRAYNEASSVPNRDFVPWLGDYVSGWLVPISGLTLVVIVAYWLISKSARHWWLWASAAVSIVVLALLLAEPYTQTYKPLGNAPLDQRIAELAARTGIPRSAVVVENCAPAASCPPGRVIGLGPTRLMLLNDALLAQNPESWTLQIVAHEAKHFVKDDNIKAFILLSALAFAALGLAHVAGHFIVARWPRLIGFSEFSSPASLPLVVVLLSAFYVIALPPVNAFRQQVELEADRFALELTRENQVQGQMLASSVGAVGRVAEWSTFFGLFRATHPSVAERVRLSNSYHPWQEGKPLKYADEFVPTAQRK